MLTFKQKMTNCKNKDFAKILMIDKEDINKYLDFKLLVNEIEKLNFSVVDIPAHKNLKGIVNNNENRQLILGKVFLLSEFL